MLGKRIDGNQEEATMFRRLALSALLFALTAPAGAASFNDLWYDPAESGWGVQVVQSNTFQFLTLFLYGTDGRPTWFTAHLNDDGTGTYTGTLRANTGTYFAAPWDPARLTDDVVGTVTFAPTDPYHATLTYALANAAPVKKDVQRQSLTPHVLSGSYSGSLTGSVTGCANAADNRATVRGRYNLAVTQVADQAATLTFSFVDSTYNGMVCTLTGPLAHFGFLYQMVDAQYGCTGQAIAPGTTKATIERLHSTQQGIEGRWTAVGGGCTQTIRFAAVEN